MSPELCAKCGTELWARSGPLQDVRLCAKHYSEAVKATPPFADGKDTGSTPGCRCDGPCPECPPGKPRKDCPLCVGYGTLCCEMPCWQRVGLTSQPCCPGCPPLPEPEAPHVATVTALASEPTRDEEKAG